MRLCKYCLMAHMDAPTGTYTVRRLTFSDGFHWCEYCGEDVNSEPARYFVMKLERVEAEKVVSSDV